MTAARPSPPASGRDHRAAEDDSERPPAPSQESAKPATTEIGGPKGPEPTRYGDWERNGRCSDF